MFCWGIHDTLFAICLSPPALSVSMGVSSRINPLSKERPTIETEKPLAYTHHCLRQQAARWGDRELPDKPSPDPCKIQPWTCGTSSLTSLGRRGCGQQRRRRRACGGDGLERGCRLTQWKPRLSGGGPRVENDESARTGSNWPAALGLGRRTGGGARPLFSSMRPPQMDRGIGLLYTSRGRGGADHRRSGQAEAAHDGALALLLRCEIEGRRWIRRVRSWQTPRGKEERLRKIQNKRRRTGTELARSSSCNLYWWRSKR